MTYARRSFWTVHTELIRKLIQEMSRFTLLFVLILSAAILAMPASGIASPEPISLQQAASGKIVDISAKGGYIGDKVRIVIDNTQGSTVEIAVVPGDMLINKNRANQNLVLGRLTGPPGRVKEGTFNGQKAYIITVRAGEKVIAEGGWTFCVDAHKGMPELGDKFDVGLNLRDFKSHPNDPRLLSLVQLADERDLFDSTTQGAVWFYTDPDTTYGHPTDVAVRELIRESGGDPDDPEPGFPHLSNPNEGSPETGAVIPPEANSINLSWQESSREVDITFVGLDMIWQSHVAVPQDAILNVAVIDRSIEGDIWEGAIYEKVDEYWELRADTTGDGSTEHYSEPAQARIGSGVALVWIRYIKGVDIWPAWISVKFWISRD